MKGSFRRRFIWPHSYLGMSLGGLLFLIFFMGSLSVFREEIDRWMMPEARWEGEIPPISVDSALRPALIDMSAGMPAQTWRIDLPDERFPLARLRVRRSGGATEAMARPDGTLLSDPGTLGASSFFYPIHYCLLLTPGRVGYWVAALCAAAMVAGLVSGVILHARLFRDLFTVRFWARPPRLLLDSHNLCGVLALPFHLMISVTGLAILLPVVAPAGIALIYGGDAARFFADAVDSYRRPASGTPAALAPLDPMLAEARAIWEGAAPQSLQVDNPGDAAAIVRINRTDSDHITLDTGSLFFDGVSGRLLHRASPPPVVAFQRFLVGLHSARFDQAWLRGLYFLEGLAGCAVIATGMAYWLERERSSGRGRRGWIMLAVTSSTATAGLMIATLAMLAANRLLPQGFAARAGCEVAVFFAAWIGCGLYAWAALRRTGALPWRRYWRTMAVLAFLCPLANRLSEGAVSLRLASGSDRAVLGIDIALLLVGGLAWRAARGARR